jgi:hypothetical protein
MPLSTTDGKRAVAIARETLEAFVGGGGAPKASDRSGVFAELRGVFVTLNTSPGGPEALRGCIGFPYPVKMLGDAIREATVAAASEDPRFPPVSKSELGSILVEVSVLTRPRAVAYSRPADRPAAVKVGEDGLMVTRPPFSGLLLPQVATEFGMDATEFLSQACMKAGLQPDAWLDASTHVETFQADIFSELSPRGEVARVDLARDGKQR